MAFNCSFGFPYSYQNCVMFYYNTEQIEIKIPNYNKLILLTTKALNCPFLKYAIRDLNEPVNIDIDEIDCVITREYTITHINWIVTKNDNFIMSDGSPYFSNGKSNIIDSELNLKPITYENVLLDYDIPGNVGGYGNHIVLQNGFRIVVPKGFPDREDLIPEIKYLEFDVNEEDYLASIFCFKKKLIKKKCIDSATVKVKKITGIVKKIYNYFPFSDEESVAIDILNIEPLN